MKGSSAISYDFRARLQVSGLKDIENTKFNLCEKNPAGDVVLNEIKLNVNTSGSFLDSFAPLSKNSFFDKARSLLSTNQKMVGLGAVRTNNVDNTIELVSKNMFQKAYWKFYPVSNEEKQTFNGSQDGMSWVKSVLNNRINTTKNTIKMVEEDRIANSENNKAPMESSFMSEANKKYKSKLTK
jgi:hypothetical protein